MGFFSKQTAKPTLRGNTFVRPDDLMQEANPEYMKSDSR